jgi:hypothetical protein
MLKFAAPILILFLVILSFVLLCSRFKLELDFSKVFDVNLPPADPGTPQVRINGVAGDSLVISFPIKQTKGAEELTVTKKNLEEIERGLDNLEFQRWESLTNLSSSLFRFNVNLYSDLKSPNNAKKASYYLITLLDGREQKVLPGHSFELSSGSKFEDLSENLSKIKIKLVYDMGMMSNTFYDEKGQFVSQSTGKIAIGMTSLTKLWIFLGVWAFWVGLIALVKQTLLSSVDFRDIYNFFKK